ncbi:restriction endonuclease [Nocardia farcinica]|uniref:restriction endonuclease n=1 Tax=Nocardia farcinica TaxID=37329 RepID=UPI000761FA24|nr:restriction endonuclease [Nocardia farcinica]AXK84771.1 restriction endonuclease [Nocardia farcinica]MBA4854455.1 restriction endonuclease [Nocardia farcinica]MBC9814640.1 restriction endonuclease [Nocardia farcinica]
MTAPVSAIPPWSGFLTPVLKVLTDGKIWRKRDLHTAVEDYVGLTAEQRAEVLPSGQGRADNRISWALSGLYRAKLVDKPARATFVITEAGRALLEAHPDGITEKVLQTVPAYRDYTPSRSGSPNVAPAIDPAEADEDVDPLEQIEHGVERLHSEVAADLLARLRGQDPAFLEQSVLDVLVAMGYGGTEGRAARIGGSGDGGVDGVIDQDPLGLERIYVQAKRYGADNTVGRPEIQAFVGALHGVGAARGVFITTSAFTSGAREYAKNIGTRIILIDGGRLAELMIRYGVAVQTRQTFTVVEVDEDYFE